MNKGYDNSRIKGAVASMIHCGEIVLALFLFVLFLMGLFHLISSLFSNGIHPFEHFHKDVEHFLGNILLLVVGLELAMLLISHKIESIVEIMFFVIARKLAVQTHGIYEMAVGISALAVLFATRKYLMLCRNSDYSESVQK